MKNNPFIIILGIAQDGGIPHCGCHKLCCQKAWHKISLQRHATSIGIIDPKTNQRWIIDATLDFKFQLTKLDRISPVPNNSLMLNGILLTHGHVGHFTGLMCLEKAVMNTKNINVFAMPKMRDLLLKNLPWKSLINNQNIKITLLHHNTFLKLNDRLSIKPFLVPHRTEFSETVGFLIKGPHRKVLFIPDVDKWTRRIITLVKNTDISFLDGTFFDGHELPGRNIKEVPHPFISESIKKFKSLRNKKKIFFIHLNHTNPALIRSTKEHQLIIKSGFKIAREEQICQL